MYEQHIILDFEMNPVLKKYAEVRKHLHREIIEIGATKVSPDGRVLDTFSCFVKPKFSSDVAEYITKLTGIKTTDIYNAASFSEAIQSIPPADSHTTFRWQSKTSLSHSFTP